jgi:hypothetical protein
MHARPDAARAFAQQGPRPPVVTSMSQGAKSSLTARQMLTIAASSELLKDAVLPSRSNGGVTMG